MPICICRSPRLTSAQATWPWSSSWFRSSDLTRRSTFVSRASRAINRHSHSLASSASKLALIALRKSACREAARRPCGGRGGHEAEDVVRRSQGRVAGPIELQLIARSGSFFGPAAVTPQLGWACRRPTCRWWSAQIVRAVALMLTALASCYLPQGLGYRNP